MDGSVVNVCIFKKTITQLTAKDQTTAVCPRIAPRPGLTLYLSYCKPLALSLLLLISQIRHWL